MSKTEATINEVDRAKEARAALKGVNAHVSALLAHNEKQCGTMRGIAFWLDHHSQQVGDIYVSTNDGLKPLRDILKKMAADLRGNAA